MVQPYSKPKQFFLFEAHGSAVVRSDSRDDAFLDQAVSTPYVV